ncbi:hypothetical protein OIE52_26845 [Streptomyces canus]
MRGRLLFQADGFAQLAVERRFPKPSESGSGLPGPRPVRTSRTPSLTKWWNG